MQPTSEHIALVTETQQIVEAVLQGRLPLEKLLEHCALSADLAQEITAKFATVEHPDPRAGSLRAAVEQLTALHNPLAGLGGALALGNHWRQRVRQTNLGYVRHHLGLSIAAEMFALKQLGQHEAILSHAEQNAALVADAGMPFTTTLMAVYCADALLELGRLDEARDLLPSRETIHEAGRQEEAATGSPPRVNLAITLRDNAAMNANFMTEAGIGEIQDFETRTRIALDETLVSVKSMLAQVGESEAEILAFEQEIENLACRRTTGTAERLQYFAELMEMLRRRLGKYAPGLSFHDDDMEIIAIGLRAEDEAAIVQALAASTRMMALQAARGDVSGWQSHAWTHAVLLEKSGRDSEALDLLEQIRRSRDDAVSRAGSARERAAIAGAFADLAPRLARLRALGGAPPSAVFEAIEWGKGQWLANGAPVPALPEFKTALERAGVHYLTFLSGSSFTLGLSISASGEVVFREITIGRDQLEAAILSIRHDPAYRAAIIRNLPAQLGALMDWVPAEATAGTLIIAPHGPLFELPLHILPCASGLPLAPACIVARTHNAAALARRLAYETTRPESHYALYAPLQTELAQPARATRFDCIAATLAQILPGQMATGPDASFEALARAARPNQLIHIWAHGDSAYDGRYFSRTGILLAAKGQLPQRGWSNFTEPHLLSPQKLLDAEPRLDFTGSHVTLQACVSAHGKANFQGDAIGLEWAFLLSGATSVLGTYWHIDYSVAAEFCRRFYAGWLTEKLTRGEAWRQTVKSMMQEAGPNSVDWAAFTLAGDWR